ncbi:ABC transporter substrate-binding protein [Rhodococcus oxybenzonivorans]|uniref:ABC transporter substrate-binding protein n=1 Tax=Rhodococcus oxybenzonivorans TaxID=1990687 RepID=UPI002955D3FD|nr:ABC transporter substrate-binding protein [Rhodococcus oxybenzonivorans]MDV7355852.1 ABC transporter substrate-binding protein [Rhodococcus oxybenzonivorans]
MAQTGKGGSGSGSSRKSARLGAWAAASVLILIPGALSACDVDNTALDGSAGQTSGEVVVGSGDTAESRVLAEIYAGALRSTGAPASTEPGLGDRTAYLRRLDAGEVTLVPEFTGRLLRYYDPESTEKEQDEVFEALSQALPQGLSISDYAAAEDRSALAVSADTSTRMAVTTLDELIPACSRSVAVLIPDFEAGSLADLTGCTFAQTRAVPDGAAAVAELSVPAQTDGAVVAGVTTATPEVASSDLVLLDDDEPIFTAQNVVPLYRVGALGEPQIKALNVVAGELTTADLADMIGQVRGGADSADVARVWLDAHV